MKVCKACGEGKPFTEFHKKLDGHQPKCKMCVKADSKAYHEKNKDRNNARCRKYQKDNSERLRAYGKNRYQKDKEGIKAYQVRYRQENKDAIRDYWRDYRKDNRHKRNTWESKRRAMKLNAAIPLSPAYDAEIEGLYEFAQIFSTGLTKFHVDHVVPLQGESVCGLHVPWNMQTISAEENLRKGNKFVDQPEDPLTLNQMIKLSGEF